MREGSDARKLSEDVLRLTHALYRVTELLPADEPLRRAMREKAGEIFAAGVAMAHGRSQAGEGDDAGVAVEILLGYLSMARALGRANPVNFLVLEREYRLLADILAGLSFVVETPFPLGNGVSKSMEGGGAVSKTEEKKEVKDTSVAWSAVARPPEVKAEKKIEQEDGMNERQKKIMERLTQSGQAKISDFYEHFNGISSKTIQRDLQDLTTRNFIKKEGEKRWTTYMLV